MQWPRYDAGGQDAGLCLCAIVKLHYHGGQLLCRCGEAGLAVDTHSRLRESCQLPLASSCLLVPTPGALAIDHLPCSRACHGMVMLLLPFGPCCECAGSASACGGPRRAVTVVGAALGTPRRLHHRATARRGPGPHHSAEIRGDCGAVHRHSGPAHVPEGVCGPCGPADVVRARTWAGCVC